METECFNNHIQGYDKSNIFSAYEAGVFFKYLSYNTLLFIMVNVFMKKVGEERIPVTLIFAANKNLELLVSFIIKHVTILDNIVYITTKNIQFIYKASVYFFFSLHVLSMCLDVHMISL